MLGFGALQPFLAGGGDGHVVVLALEPLTKRLGDLHFVLYDEHPGGHTCLRCES
jgi:hypothetical protein